MTGFPGLLQECDPPPAVRDRARLAFMDTLGCLLAGTRSPAFAAADRAARADGGRALRCHAWAVAASAFDQDDGHYEGGGVHLGSVILPVLLDCSGRDTTREALLTALALGYEVAIRAGWLLMPERSGGLYHTTGAATVLGAAVAGAHLVGLGEAGARRALRIASAHAPMATLQLPMVKESIGWAAATAVGAILSTQAGFGGPDEAEALPPILGIAPTPFDTAAAADPFAASLGTVWHGPATYIKPYPCCRAIHAALDALGAILAGQGWTAGAVEQVEVRVVPGLEALAYLPPLSPDHAQFSFPFALGCLLAHGSVEPSHFLPDALNDPAVLAAAHKIILRPDPAIVQVAPDRSYPAEVRVRAHGREQRLRIDDALGSVNHPMSAEAVRRKYLANAAFAGVGAAEAAALLTLPPAELVARLIQLPPSSPQESSS